VLVDIPQAVEDDPSGLQRRPMPHRLHPAADERRLGECGDPGQLRHEQAAPAHLLPHSQEDAARQTRLLDEERAWPMHDAPGSPAYSPGLYADGERIPDGCLPPVRTRKPRPPSGARWTRHDDKCSCDAWRRQIGIYGRCDFSPGRLCIADRWFGLRLSRFGGDFLTFLPRGGSQVGRLGLGAG
jgi:hypothetical protein